VHDLRHAELEPAPSRLAIQCSIPLRYDGNVIRFPKPQSFVPAEAFAGLEIKSTAWYEKSLTHALPLSIPVSMERPDHRLSGRKAAMHDPHMNWRSEGP
jgi:hypothetical protein